MYIYVLDSLILKKLFSNLLILVSHHNNLEFLYFNIVVMKDSLSMYLYTECMSI